MTWSVYQHWDPLRVCIVGRSYPPEFYSWITVPHVRELFERIAVETEEDYQNIINKLKSFGVKVLRPNLPAEALINGKFVPPPMTPRDYIGVVGNTLYYNDHNLVSRFQDFAKIYSAIKDPSWPDCQNLKDFKQLPDWIQNECVHLHRLTSHLKPRISDNWIAGLYDHVIAQVIAQGNTVKQNVFKNSRNDVANTAMVSRIGCDLVFGTTSLDQDRSKLLAVINNEFTHTRNYVVNTGGHTDGTFCVVCPGLVISINENINFDKCFPGWEVIVVPPPDWSKIQSFVDLKQKNCGRWWIPGFEHDQDVVNLVEDVLSHWTGYVEETVFDINMLIIDPKNVMVSNYNKTVFDALERYGITPHLIPLRHRYFWDGGIHCMTSDLHREGSMQDYFIERKNV
jgi:hypothetical protein